MMLLIGSSPHTSHSRMPLTSTVRTSKKLNRPIGIPPTVYPPGASETRPHALITFPVISGKQISVRMIEEGTEDVPIGGTGGTGIGGGPICSGETIALPSRVTAPVNAMALPVIAAPVPKDTDDRAITSPCIDALALIVAELPTNQITLRASAPPKIGRAHV